MVSRALIPLLTSILLTLFAGAGAMHGQSDLSCKTRSTRKGMGSMQTCTFGQWKVTREIWEVADRGQTFSATQWYVKQGKSYAKVPTSSIFNERAEELFRMFSDSVAAYKKELAAEEGGADCLERDPDLDPRPAPGSETVDVYIDQEGLHILYSLGLPGFCWGFDEVSATFPWAVAEQYLRKP